MDTENYRDLAEKLAGAGIVCRFQQPKQLTVSWQVGNIWLGKGNTFWVTCATGVWHLVTWSPIGYHVPTNIDIAKLCQHCMSIGQQAMHALPKEIVDEYALRRLTENELQALFRAMDTQSGG